MTERFVNNSYLATNDGLPAFKSNVFNPPGSSPFLSAFRPSPGSSSVNMSRESSLTIGTSRNARSIRMAPPGSSQLKIRPPNGLVGNFYTAEEIIQHRSDISISQSSIKSVTFNKNNRFISPVNQQQASRYVQPVNDSNQLISCSQSIERQLFKRPSPVTPIGVLQPPSLPAGPALSPNLPAITSVISRKPIVSVPTILRKRTHETSPRDRQLIQRLGSHLTSPRRGSPTIISADNSKYSPARDAIKLHVSSNTQNPTERTETVIDLNNVSPRKTPRKQVFNTTKKTNLPTSKSAEDLSSHMKQDDPEPKPERRPIPLRPHLALAPPNTISQSSRAVHFLRLDDFKSKTVDEPSTKMSKTIDIPQFEERMRCDKLISAATGLCKLREIENETFNDINSSLKSEKYSETFTNPDPNASLSEGELYHCLTLRHRDSLEKLENVLSMVDDILDRRPKVKSLIDNYTKGQR